MLAILESARFLSDARRPMGGKAIWKYLVRAILLFPWASLWARYLLRDAEMRQMLAMRPRLLCKLQRPYMRRGATPGQRLKWLMQHYGWMREHWPAAFTLELFERGRLVLATLSGECGATYHITLRPTCKFDREGELLLTLEQDGDALALLSFAMQRTGVDWVANIGCIQGPRPALGREAVKHATGDLYGLRPKQAVLVALYAVTRAYGASGVRAVTNADHVHQARWRSRSHVAADYDAFWAEMGGVHVGNSFELPTRLARKTIAEIPSKKRAQYRRRHALEDAMIGQICSSLPGSQAAFVFEPRRVETPQLTSIESVAANTISGYQPLRIAA